MYSTYPQYQANWTKSGRSFELKLFMDGFATPQNGYDELILTKCRVIRGEEPNKGANADIALPILYGKAKIEIVDKDYNLYGRLYDRLQNANEEFIRCDINIDDNLYWRGFIFLPSVRKKVNDDVVFLSIEAFDGLGLLKSLFDRNLSNNSVAMVLSEIITSISMDLDFKVYMDLKDDASVGTNLPDLVDLWIGAQTPTELSESDYYTFLLKLLQLLNMQMVQEDGFWKLLQRDYKEESITYWELAEVNGNVSGSGTVQTANSLQFTDIYNAYYDAIRPLSHCKVRYYDDVYQRNFAILNETFDSGTTNWTTTGTIDTSTSGQVGLNNVADSLTQSWARVINTNGLDANGDPFTLDFNIIMQATVSGILDTSRTYVLNAVEFKLVGVNGSQNYWLNNASTTLGTSQDFWTIEFTTDSGGSPIGTPPFTRAFSGNVALPSDWQGYCQINIQYQGDVSGFDVLTVFTADTDVAEDVQDNVYAVATRSTQGSSVILDFGGLAGVSVSSEDTNWESGQYGFLLCDTIAYRRLAQQPRQLKTLSFNCIHTTFIKFDQIITFDGDAFVPIKVDDDLINDLQKWVLIENVYDTSNISIQRGLYD